MSRAIINGISKSDLTKTQNQSSYIELFQLVSVINNNPIYKHQLCKLSKLATQTSMFPSNCVDESYYDGGIKVNSKKDTNVNPNEFPGFNGVPLFSMQVIFFDLDNNVRTGLKYKINY